METGSPKRRWVTTFSTLVVETSQRVDHVVKSPDRDMSWPAALELAQQELKKMVGPRKPGVIVQEVDIRRV